MDKGSRTLGWFGLIVGGSLSVGANVRSIHLPGMPAVDFGSYVVAVAPVALAMLGIEQVARWKHLPNKLRYGVVGLASLIAVAASWTHIVAVMKFYGQAAPIAYSFPLAVDGIMLLSSLSLFVPFPDKRTQDTDTPEPVVQADTVDTSGWTWTRTDTDNGADSLPVDTEPEPDTDTPDTALDADTLYVPDTFPGQAPVDTVDMPARPLVSVKRPDGWDMIPTAPRPRRAPDTGWRVLAREALSLGYAPAEIAGAILENEPTTWPSMEAGRKAVSRLR